MQTDPSEIDLRSELQESIYGLIQTQTLYVAARLGLADLLADGARSVDDLAAATATHAPTLRRLLRYLASRGLFAQDEQGLFSLTTRGAVFRGMKAEAIYWGDRWNWDSWTSLLDSVRTGQTSFDLSHGSSLFSHMAQNQDDASVFNSYMTAMAGGRGFAAVPQVYDFSRAKLVVDVGGGHGALLVSILTANPGSAGTVFDLPEVTAGARSVIESAGLAQRCELAGGSFFDSVPAGGDVYVLSNILHDWDDERCLVILRNCRRAMTSDSRLIVMEAVVPEGNDPSLAKLVDVIMMALTGGLQRTETEYASLFERSGLRMTRVLPMGPISSIIEAEPA